MAERQSKPFQKFLLILRLVISLNCLTSLRKINFGIYFGTR